MLILFGRVEQDTLVDRLKHRDHGRTAAHKARELNQNSVRLLELNCLRSGCFIWQATIAKLKQNGRTETLPSKLQKRRVLFDVV